MFVTCVRNFYKFLKDIICSSTIAPKKAVTKMCNEEKTIWVEIFPIKLFS